MKIRTIQFGKSVLLFFAMECLFLWGSTFPLFYKDNLYLIPVLLTVVVGIVAFIYSRIKKDVVLRDFSFMIVGLILFNTGFNWFVLVSFLYMLMKHIHDEK